MRNWEHNTRISEEVKDWKHSTISVDQRERFYSFGLLICLSSCVEVAVGEKYNVQIGWLRENTKERQIEKQKRLNRPSNFAKAGRLDIILP
jgi:hypothetical protein